MTNAQLSTLLDVAGNLTVAGLLLLIVIALMRGWMVTSREFNDMRRQRDQFRREADEWKRIALQGARIAARAVHVAERVPGRGRGHDSSTGEDDVYEVGDR